MISKYDKTAKTTWFQAGQRDLPDVSLLKSFFVSPHFLSPILSHFSRSFFPFISPHESPYWETDRSPDLTKGGLTDDPSRSPHIPNGRGHHSVPGGGGGGLGGGRGGVGRGGGGGRAVKSITMRNYAPYNVDIIVSFGNHEQADKYGRYIMKRKALGEYFGPGLMIWW